MSLYFLKWRVCRLWPPPRWWTEQSSGQRWLTAQPLLLVYFLAEHFAKTWPPLEVTGWAFWCVGMAVLLSMYGPMVRDIREWYQRCRHTKPCPVCHGDFKSYWAASQDRELKAQELLREHLTELQWTHWECWRIVFVKGGRTGRLYVVEANGEVYSVNIAPVGGRREKYYCIHVKRDCGCRWPYADIVLAKVMMIRFDERRFLRKANVFDHVGRAGDRLLSCRVDAVSGSAIWAKIVRSITQDQTKERAA